MSEEISAQQANEALTNAVETYIERMDWKVDGMALTDVLVVAVRRGWAADGGKSLINAVYTTDTSPIMALGMIKYAQMKYERVAQQGFEEAENDDAD